MMCEGMDNSRKLYFKWKEFQQNVSLSFRQLSNDLDFSDLTLACGSEQIEAHKIVLSSASSFFRKLLKKNKHPQPLIYLKGVMEDDMKAILDFIYLGEVSIPEENLDSFLSLAKEFELKAISLNTETTENPKENHLRIKTPVLINEEIDLIQLVRDENSQVGASIISNDINEDINKIEKKLKLIEKTEYTTKAAVQKPFDLPKHTVIVDPLGVTNVIVNKDTTENDFTSLVDSMMKQMPSENGRASWECAVCEKTAADITHLRYHVETHIKGFSNSCEECGKSFGNSRKLRVHQKVCGEQMTDATGLALIPSSGAPQKAKIAVVDAFQDHELKAIYPKVYSPAVLPHLVNAPQALDHFLACWEEELPHSLPS